jgi:hypothetical protein
MKLWVAAQDRRRLEDNKVARFHSVGMEKLRRRGEIPVDDPESERSLILHGSACLFCWLGVIEIG